MLITGDIPPADNFASILKEMLIESGWLVQGTKTGRMSSAVSHTKGKPSITVREEDH